MKKFNQSFLLSLGKLILSLVIVGGLASVMLAQINDESLPTTSSAESRAASVSTIVEFENARIRSDSTRLSEAGGGQRLKAANVVYERTSHSSYNDDLAEIYFVGKNQYEIDVESHQIIQFGPRPLTFDDPKPTAVNFSRRYSPKQLRKMAYGFAEQYSSVPLSTLNESSTDKDAMVYFFRWETSAKNFDGLPAFIQVGLSSGGDLVSYTNTLDLNEKKSEESSFQLEALAPSIAGVYIFANNGINYREYGPKRYWWTANNEGYCSTRISKTCNPKYMRYTYESWRESNYAEWQHPNSYVLGTHKVFIPRVNATTRQASYYILYDRASSATFSLDQLLYSDAWVQTRTLRSINFTHLSDSPFAFSSPTGKKVGFDEIQIAY